MKERVITDALSGFTIGIKTVVYTAIQHYYHGISISKILQNLKIHSMTLTEGALVGQWHALAELFKPLYNEIHKAIKGSTGAVYADETGHRQKGKKFWLWSFSTRTEALFAIRNNRSGRVVIEILGKVFEGILVTDFWAPYLAVSSRLRQWCVAHFLREFKKIEFRRSKPPPEFYQFKKKVIRLFRDALRFSKKKSSKKERQKAYARFLKRLDAVVQKQYHDPDVKRLVKRLRKFRNGFFTFVIVNGVDATNNFAERIIRAAVIMRKISFHTMSNKGSETMETLMSIFKTLDLRGEDVFQRTLEIAKSEISNKAHKSINIDLAA